MKTIEELVAESVGAPRHADQATERLEAMTMRAHRYEQEIIALKREIARLKRALR